MPKITNKKTPFEKRKEARKRKLAKERALWASQGLQKPQKPRYSGLQGVLWYLTSKTVRMEDFEAYKGKCITCPIVLTDWHDGDCGHFQTAGKASTRFERKNLALQCRPCNTRQHHGDSTQYVFGVEIDKRYGEGTAMGLVDKSKTLFVITDDWLKEKINEYKQKLEKLSQRD